MAAEIVRILETQAYPEQIDRAAALLRDGGIVVLPTETVYGIAARLDHPVALERLRALRTGSSPSFTPHVYGLADALAYLGEISDLGKRMMGKLWPGPVGLSFRVSVKDQTATADRLRVQPADLYQDDRIILRCPDHAVAREIILRAGVPIIAIGAGGQKVADLPALTLEQTDLIIDAGTTRFSRPSTLVQVDGDRWEIVRAGIFDERIIERMLHTRILYICSGNTCRSPMAEAITRTLLANKLGIPEMQLESKGISVASAGSYAMPGSRATPEAIDAVRRLGADLSHHRSQPLSVELIHQSDLIFTMGRGHRQAAVSLVPGASAKVLNLDPTSDIEDPIGGDATLYVKLAEKMKGLIESRLKEAALV